ncbi:MAG: hypothetical protein IPN71_02095 [Fibrobacteres bacterium]|nr:hypothetical protein [Fibrobacterota bacterium]
MSSFIHITDANEASLIQRSGIKLSRIGTRKGVYCFPVLKDFHMSHQWARELKRSGVRGLVCIQFKLPDDMVVEVGKYNQDKIRLASSEAIHTIMNHSDPYGLEVIVPEKILPSQIQRIYPAPRLTGWRYYPEAKGKKPFCHCRYCNRGEIKANRLIRED